MVSIEDAWKEATEGFSSDICNNWFIRLQEVYSNEKRTYHNLDFLREKFHLYTEIKNCLKSPKPIILAIFFQNFECDPKVLDGENQNLDFFKQFADEAGITEDNEIFIETTTLLKAIATHSTEEHKIGGAYGSDDMHYLLDLDMAVLGSTPEIYLEYREKIRGEYSFLSEPMYTALRLKVLQNFVQIPNIFATKEFREKYEDQARQNILTEIEMLS